MNCEIRPRFRASSLCRRFHSNFVPEELPVSSREVSTQAPPAPEAAAGLPGQTPPCAPSHCHHPAAVRVGRWIRSLPTPGIPRWGALGHTVLCKPTTRPPGQQHIRDHSPRMKSECRQNLLTKVLSNHDRLSNSTMHMGNGQRIDQTWEKTGGDMSGSEKGQYA